MAEIRNRKPRGDVSPLPDPPMQDLPGPTAPPAMTTLVATGTCPVPDPYPKQCPDLLPTGSGKPHLDALGNPYRCELGRDHGGPLHSGGGVRWPNRDYSPSPARPRAVRRYSFTRSELIDALRRRKPLASLDGPVVVLEGDAALESMADGIIEALERGGEG